MKLEGPHAKGGNVVGHITGRRIAEHQIVAILERAGGGPVRGRAPIARTGDVGAGPGGDDRRDDLHRSKATRMCSVTQLAVRVVTHAPEAAVGLDKKAMSESSGNGYDVAGDRHGEVALGGRAIAQLAGTIQAHGPKAAIGLDEKA